MRKGCMLVVLGAGLFAIEQAHAQPGPLPEYFYTGQLPQNYVPRAVGDGVGQMYDYSQQPNEIRQMQNDYRNSWIYQQQQQQQWIQQQNALRAMQQQQTYLRPMPGSTPMFAPAVPPGYQQQMQHQFVQQYNGRQQILQQWRMAPLPPFGGGRR